MLARLDRTLTAICKTGTGLAFAVLIVAVLTQVIGRSVINDSPPWTEELTRYALLWLVAFGTGLSLRSGDLVNVDIVSEAVPERIGYGLRLACAVITAAFCIALIWPAWFYTSIGIRQTSPVLKIRMDFIHASVLFLLAVLAIFALMRIAGMLTGKSDGRPNAMPELEP